jgi:putative ABC transport system permease protein
MAETLLRDLRYAARAMSRARGVTAVAVLTLALGIGATTTMFSVAYAALWRPLPFAGVDRLVVLYQTRVTPRDGLVRLRWSKPVVDSLQQNLQETAVQAFRPAVGSRAFDSIATFTPTNLTLSAPGDAEQLDGETVSPEYFATLRIAPILGRLFADETVRLTPDATNETVVIAERLWQRRFNRDPQIVGRVVRVNDVPLTIAGVLPAPFAGLSGRSQLWIPRTLAPRLTYSEYLTTPQHFISVIARIATDLDRVNAALAAIGPRLGDRGSPPGAQWSARAVPLTEARVDPTLRRSVIVLVVAAVCVLLTASVNVAALLLARARMRQREMAVRLAIGSSRTRLVRQLLTESALLAAVASTGGIVIAAWGIDLFASIAPDVIASARNDYGTFAPFATPTLDVRMLLFTMAVTIGTTVVCGLVPALQASRPDLVAGLRQNDRGGTRHRMLATLVATEIALAVLLLASSGLLLESFVRIEGMRAGFVADNVLTFWVRPPNSKYLPADGPAIVERVLTRIEQTPGVRSAAVNRCTPFTGCARTTIFFADRPTDPLNAPPVGRHYVSAEYFRTLGIPVLAGRALTTADRIGRPPVTVINETAARRFWPGEDPIGKRVWFGSATGFTDPARPVEVVGVVGDVKYAGVDQPVNADFYTSYLQFAYPDTMVIVKAAGPATAVVPALRSAVASVDGSIPIFDVLTLDDRIAAAVSRPRFNASVVSLFAAAALLLAAIGVYGMLSYSVSSRMREIGVRLALGADSVRVMRLVVGDGLRLTLIGGAIGAAGAVAAARLLRGWLTGVGDLDPWMLAGVAILMLGVAAVAAFLPARRAGAVDPLSVLRSE